MSIKTIAKATALYVSYMALEHFAGKLVDKSAGRAMRLSMRRNQVHKTNIRLKNQDWTASDYTIHDHHAKRRGRHRDIRIQYKDRALSLVHNDGLPKKTGVFRNLFRTADHVLDYMNFSGTIPDGEFGAGRVIIEEQGTGFLKIDSSKKYTTMKFMIPDGKSQGLYSFVELSHQAYRVYKHKIPAHIKMERHKYNLLRSNVLKSNKELNSSNYMAEEKMDGAYSAMRIGEHGSSMTGRRESVNGGSIPYTYKMPHLAIIKSKKYAGSVVIGETFHSKGASFLAGILNSLPGNVYRTQTEHGLMKFYPFDIKTLKIHGKTVKLDSYADKRKVLDELISTFDNQHIKKVRRTINNKPAFYSKIISNGGEGIVLKNVKDNQEPWYKIVATDIADLKITGYTEGTGRLKDKGIGALVLQDQSGKYKVNVGTGLSDELRFHIYQNPKEYIGKIAKVEYRKQTKQSLVAPRFQGFHISKVTPDNMAG